VQDEFSGDLERPSAPPPTGVFVPVLTPFDDDGEVDRPALIQAVDFYLARGVHGLFLLDAAGQGPVMRSDQRRTVAEIVLDRAGDRTPVIVHVGTADVQTTVQIARHAAGLQAAALAVSPPYYYSDHTPYEISAHFAAVAEAVEAPILVYDHPRYAGIGMSPASIFRLARALPSIQGVILAAGSMEATLQHLRTHQAPFAVYTGVVECVAATQPYGLHGVMTALAAPFPELIMSLWEALVRRDFEAGIEVQHRLNEMAAVIDRYAMTTGRTVWRDLLRLRGLTLSRYPRWPSQELDEDSLHRLHEDLEQFGAFAIPPQATQPGFGDLAEAEMDEAMDEEEPPAATAETKAAEAN
jgi:dihydrodipicolinate synthase/N-acetylneuraminate lyase